MGCIMDKAAFSPPDFALGRWILMKGNRSAVFLALAAALCYGLSAPVSKLLMGRVAPVLLAALLYLGAGLGMGAVLLLERRSRAGEKEARVTRQELPWVAAMVALDIAAPVLLMTGLAVTAPGTVSLINNFEIVVTAAIALLIFREAVGKRMWLAIVLITLSTAVLSMEELWPLTFSPGALLVLLACVCWGFENNCTRMLSLKNPVQIVTIKGLGSGLGALIIAAFSRQLTGDALYIALSLALGFVAYGLSIFFYIHAQRRLGAARTSAYYAAAPFIGVGLSFALDAQPVTAAFLAGLGIMALGTYLAAFERHGHSHRHEALTHEHRHDHADGHHGHCHDCEPEGEHCHEHCHEPLAHSHAHMPDMHHGHSH